MFTASTLFRKSRPFFLLLLPPPASDRIRVQVVPALDLLDDHTANERASPGVCEHRRLGRVGGIEKTEADTEPLMQDFAFDTQATLFSGEAELGLLVNVSLAGESKSHAVSVFDAALLLTR